MTSTLVTERSNVAFQQQANTSSIAMTTASAGVAFTGGTAQAQLLNNSAGVAFVRFSTDNSAATAADYPVAPGAVVVVTLDPNAPPAYVQAILALGTGTLYITPGQGL